MRARGTFDHALHGERHCGVIGEAKGMYGIGHPFGRFDLLNGTEGIPRYIEVSCVADVYPLQKAKPKSRDAVSSVTCPEDLEVEIMGALEVEEAEPRDRTQAFLSPFFE